MEDMGGTGSMGDSGVMETMEPMVMEVMEAMEPMVMEAMEPMVMVMAQLGAQSLL